MPRPLFPADQLPQTRSTADVAFRRLLGLLLFLLLLAACIRPHYRPRKNTPSWAQRERQLEADRPRH